VTRKNDSGWRVASVAAAEVRRAVEDAIERSLELVEVPA
jgi:hypothetical protein